MPRAAFALSLLLALSLTAPAAIAAPSSAACTFVGGFATLHELAPDVVGDCTEPEHHDPKSGDALQATTRGLLVWRKADNWTAFTDGGTTWINGPYGLQSRPNDRRFAWEPPVLPLFEELRAFDGQPMVPSETQEPFRYYSINGDFSYVGVDSYHLVYGDERLGGNGLVLDGSLGGQPIDPDAPDPFWPCIWSNRYCDSRATNPDSQFTIEGFKGLAVNGLSAEVIHSSVPYWAVAWYDPSRNATYGLKFTGDAADNFGTGFEPGHRAEAERLVSIASQLVSLHDLTVFAPAR